MKRSILFLLAALCGLASTPALAATPHPTAADADRDGVYVATVDVNADGRKNHLDIGVRASQYDCDDVHSTVSPRLTEVVGDGIDNDCSGADANWPPGVTDVIAARFIASGSKSPTIFITEYDACKAAAECEIDTVAGTFKITPAAQDTHRFVDIYVNGSKVLRNNGQKGDGREVITVEEFEHFRGGSASGSGSSGPSKATRAKETTAIVTPLVTAEAEARLTADSAHDSRLSTIETGNAGRDGEINRLADVDAALEGRLADQEKAILAEARVRAKADADLTAAAAGASWRAETASETASTAVSLAYDAASHGPLFEGYLLGGLVSGRPVPSARNAVGIGGGAGLNIGIDGADFRANAFADILFGGDGSDLATSWALGGEYLWEILATPVHIGLFGAYSERSSLVNALETQVRGRNPIAGLSLAIPFAQNDRGMHGLFQVRAGCGPEFVGTAGDEITTATGLGCRFGIGFGGGVGALR